MQVSTTNAGVVFIIKGGSILSVIVNPVVHVNMVGLQDIAPVVLLDTDVTFVNIDQDVDKR